MSRLDRGYSACRALHRRHGTTYFWATQVLPAERRRHVYAFYGFCRYADEIVDGAGFDSHEQRARALAELGSSFERAWAGSVPHQPVVAAVVQTMRELRQDPELISRFLRSMAMDLSVSAYETWDELCSYVDGSAAVIGEMVLPVLCPDPVQGALRPARQLGVAFQMTNFLRDVGEDLARGRVYLPAEDLRRFGADPWARAVTPEWVALMKYEIQRTRMIYREAATGTGLLPPRAAACVRTAASLYGRILERIEANGYDVFARRARVALPVKLAVVARGMVATSVPVRLGA
jgi:phytoene synthase